jgi:hypothetical protein
MSALGRKRTSDHPISITSSARAINIGGTITPRALAVFTFTVNWSLVGNLTGKSPGLAPFRILSTKSAARRWFSESSQSGEAAQNIQTVQRRRRREEVRNCIGTSSRSLEELYRPFGHARFLDVNVRTGLRLTDVFKLTYQCERSLRALGVRREIESIHVRCEGVVVIAAVVQIRRPALWVAPNTVLQHLVPHEAAAGAGGSRIGSHEIWIYGVGVFRSECRNLVNAKQTLPRNPLVIAVARIFLTKQSSF